MTVSDALRRASALAGDSPRIDTEVLLCHALQKTRAWLYAWPDAELTQAQEARFDSFLARRQQGEPVAYITGRRGFWAFDLRVTPDVLIPRPETELLVEMALEAGPALRAADLGTGSGAIALALASEWPSAHIIAVDKSVSALAVARSNAVELGLSNIEFRQGSWCEPIGELLDLIVSNPPYIADGDVHLQSGDLRFEPLSALTAGSTGLDDIAQIVRQARHSLRPGGRLLLEHGHTQAADVAVLLAQEGYTQILTRQDLAGRNRVTGGIWNSGDRQHE